MKKHPVKYQESSIELVFQKLISNWPELEEFYRTQVYFKYENPNDKLVYVDISDIARFVVEKYKTEDFSYFDVFFQNVEEIVLFGNASIQNFIQIGLFESIQNTCSAESGYQRFFDRWLRVNSLKSWRELIDYWEGDEWKKTIESQRILKK